MARSMKKNEEQEGHTDRTNFAATNGQLLTLIRIWHQLYRICIVSKRIVSYSTKIFKKVVRKDYEKVISRITDTVDSDVECQGTNNSGFTIYPSNLYSWCRSEELLQLSKIGAAILIRAIFQKTKQVLLRHLYPSMWTNDI